MNKRTLLLGAFLPLAAAAQSPPSGTIFNPSISVIGNFLAVAGHNHLAVAPYAENGG